MTSKRNLGLDMIRIFAAFLVIICHSGYFSVGIPFSVVDFTGILAVEIFFVLSGLLVGKSLIFTVTDPQPGNKLKRFYINRAFRTLPVYYLMLFLSAWLKGTGIPFSCFVFLQNFTGDLWLMPVTWSLSVEMWFYFAVPPVFVLLFRLFSKKYSTQKAVFLSIGVVYTFSFLLRIFSVLTLNPAWDDGVRKQVLLRMDSIMTGVFFAALKLYKKDTYLKISKHSLALIGSVAGILMAYYLHTNYYIGGNILSNSSLYKIFAFSVLPVLCILLVMYLENAQWIDNLKRFRVFHLVFWLSSLTYGIYLAQLAVFELVSPYFWEAGFAANWLGFAGSIALTVLAAQILFWLVEKPCEKLRDKVLSK